MSTGIYYHASFSQRSYLTVGRRLAHFPGVISPALARPGVHLFTCQPVDEELVRKVHTDHMLDMIEKDPLCSTARHSAGGVVEAVGAVGRGKLDRAFCFIGAGGHHAGARYFWGYCCFNDVVLALVSAREKLGLSRVAVLDTDAHHGDGTRELLADRGDVLHICFCDRDEVSPDRSKVDVDVTLLGGNPDTSYLELVRKELCRLADFKPELLIWYFGFDTCDGEYGSIGLTPAVYPALAREMVAAARKYAGGRLVVVLGGGSRTDLADIIIGPVIEVLAGEESAP